MILYSGLSSKIYRILGDTEENQYSEEVIWDAICAAQTAILPWVPRFSVSTYTSGSSTSVFALPADIYQIDSVQELTTSLFVPRATLAPRTARSSTGMVSDNDWVDYPYGSISLANPIPTAGEIKIFYRSYWPAPLTTSEPNFILEFPAQATAGVTFYAAAYALNPRFVVSGGIAQYRLRVDSGNPEHNPLENLSDLFMHRFYQEMKLMPSYSNVAR